jgi:ankyrin repeat protein
MEDIILKSTANLIRAIKNDDEAECRRILETECVDIHKKDSEITELKNEPYHIRAASPIVIACDVGNYNIVEMLLENGANINDTSERGLTPLMKASIYNHINVIELLLSKGVDIHEQNSNGATAILYASLHSQKDAIQLLMANGASIYDTIGEVGNNVYNATFNQELKFILRKWPITMAIIMLKELLVYSPLDYLLLDLQEYLNENDVIEVA